MRGKKVNTEFVVQFIDESVAKGLNSKELMLKAAQAQIEAIELELKKMHEKQILRSNLLDVVFTLKNK